MEENNTKTENNKLSYEQLERVAAQLQQRVVQAEARLNSINVSAIRLEYLFRVLDRASHFPEKFVEDCAAEIVDLLEVKKPDTEPQAIDFPEE